MRASASTVNSRRLPYSHRESRKPHGWAPTSYISEMHLRGTHLVPQHEAETFDELEWPIGPEGNEEGAKPAARAVRETTSEVLTG